VPPELSAAKLGAPVGPNQTNAPGDVQTVQRLLNAIIMSGGLPGAHNPIAESGLWDNVTLRVMLTLERDYFYGDADPLHRVLPNGQLLHFLIHAATEADHTDLSQHLSDELYKLAAIMVPGGADWFVRHKGKKPERHAGNIRTYLPCILQALDKQGLGDVDMLLMALATIRAETASFQPIPEGVSVYNTSPKGTPDRHAFDLYDSRDDIGNTGSPDGSDYRGRGFVQLTGRANYRDIGKQIGVKTQLVDSPDDADDPDVAAQILAQFLKNHESEIRAALKRGDLATARQAVNGGSHGLADFTDAYQAGRRFLGTKLLHKARAKAKAKP
jgi:hypothetical protein